MENYLNRKKLLDFRMNTKGSMLAIAILAAGKGTRMKSSFPKILQQLAGKTLIERVLDSCNQIKPDRKILVVGHQAQKVENALNSRQGLEFILQEPQNGTGHAIQKLSKVLSQFEGDLLVLNGDVPLLRPSTIQTLLTNHHSNNASVTLLSTRVVDSNGYGRVFANKDGKVNKIIEERDCNEEELSNKLINAGVYCFNWKELAEVLPKLSNKNEQNEIYLTDAIPLLRLSMHIKIDDPKEVSGVNDKYQLYKCESYLQERLKNHWMREGVTFIDPISCTIDEECVFGSDVVIEPQTHIKGKSKIGDNCHLGPGSFIRNSELDDGVSVIYSVLNSAKVGKNVQIGPYSNIRPQTFINNNCRIGNFVEIKKSNIGNESKINHLSYIGDAQINANVNIGAGTITANYDGKRKHKTIIGEGSRTGANSVLVAPINIGNNVTIGAGSTLTEDVPSEALAIARSNQIVKSDWCKKE